MDMLRAVITDLLDMGISEERIIREVRSISATRALNKLNREERRNEQTK